MATKRPVNKVKNDAHRAKGKVKQTTGRVTHDDALRARGFADEAVADIREMAEKARELVEGVGNKAGRAMRDTRDKAGEIGQETREKLKNERR